MDLSLHLWSAKQCYSTGQNLSVPLFMEGEELEQVERFTYLGSCISTNGNITSEITARISKAQAAFSNLRHLWRCTDVSLGYQRPSV